jgi:hypothetical protein
MEQALVVRSSPSVFTLKMEAERSSETLIKDHDLKRRNSFLTGPKREARNSIKNCERFGCVDVHIVLILQL